MSQNTQLHSFIGSSTSDILKAVAAWFDSNPEAVLIGLWNTGFGEAWEVCIQVVVDHDSSDGPWPQDRTLYRGQP